MALVRRFERSQMVRNSVHDAIDAKYTIFEKDGKAVFRSMVSVMIPGKFQERKV